jgi:hypothetical protein
MAVNSSSSVAALFRALLVAGLPATAAYGQLQIAESLLINLNPSTFNNGDTTWTNTGTLTGDFFVDGTRPVKGVADGVSGLIMDGGDHFLGPNSTTGIDGAGTSSIEVWAYQVNARREESLVTWGHRGADGRNMSFNYGSDDRWGAVGHWGGADIGWGPNNPNGTGGLAPGTPELSQWHHLAYTYDGTTQKVYKDGVLVNQENVALNIFESFPIQVGAQRNDVNPLNVEGGLQFSGVLGQVRIHDGVLTDAQVTQNFNAEKTNYHYDAAGTYLPSTPLGSQALPRGPVHRYTMDGLASGVDGTVVPDIIGTGANQANGVIRGTGAIVTGGGIDLPGGSSQTQAYLDFPNGLVSGTFNNGLGYADASYEVWITVQSNQNWSRVMDFGTSTSGELIGPGGAFDASRSIMVSATNGTDAAMRFELAGQAAQPGPGTRDAGGNQLGLEMQVVMVYNSGLQQWQFYRDGLLLETFDSVGTPNTLADVNNWLGRSMWAGDANTDAVYNEFRVYDFALSPENVRSNFLAGPDTVNVVPESSTWTALIGGAGLLLGLQRAHRRAVGSAV